MRLWEMVTASGKWVVNMAVLLGAAGIASFGGGCKAWLDPTELPRGGRSDRLVVPILNSIDPIDESDIEFTGASDVRPQDLKVIEADYEIGPNDLITVSVFDLVNMGVESVRTARVSQTGMLSLPLLQDPVRAAGLTEQELQRAIADRYREAGLIQNAQVNVIVVEARQRTFYVSGSVARPGQYAILDAEFRLLNALVQAGDTTFPADYAYVIRRIRSETPATRPAEEEGLEPAPPREAPDLEPRSDAARAAPVLAMLQQPNDELAPTQTQPAAGEERFIYIDGRPVLVGATQPAGETAVQPSARDDELAPDTERQPDFEQPEYEFGAELMPMQDTRVIRVPLRELRNGDLRYNIVIRANDYILVPPPAIGEYYMGGHVGAPGVYSLTGRKITLKQAIISARMLDPLAIPQRTDIVRRIDQDKEIFVRVNLAKVFEGRQPDIYLKPNDVITVGTDFYTPFLAAIRGAFRFTYGFGFIYDRNYAPTQRQRFR